jgi:uncharacterized HAD superfamily protein
MNRLTQYQTRQKLELILTQMSKYINQSESQINGVMKEKQSLTDSLNKATKRSEFYAETLMAFPIDIRNLITADSGTR